MKPKMLTQAGDLPTHSGVYLIENIKTGLVYVGSTKNIRSRVLDHLAKLRRSVHPNRRLRASWDKDGVDSFIVKVVIRCGVDENIHYEQQVLDIYKRHHPIANNDAPVDRPAKGVKRFDAAVGRATLDRVRPMAIVAYAEFVKNSPEFQVKRHHIGQRMMKRLRSIPEIEAKRKENVAKAMSRPEVREKRRQAARIRIANGTFGGRKGVPAKNRCSVINTDTMQIFDSITAAGESLGKDVATMHGFVNGRKQPNGQYRGKKPNWWRHKVLPTYDIANVGTHNRFFVRNQNGQALCVHNCGYSLSGKAFSVLSKATYGIDVDEQEAKRLVDLYRQNNANIVNLWRTCEQVLHELVLGHEGYFGGPTGRLFYFGQRHLFNEHITGIRLPDGMWLYYRNLRIVNEVDDYGKPREVFIYDYFDKRKHVEKKIYGGALTENLVQALAFAIMKRQAIKISERMPIAFNVHDEFVCVVDEDNAKQAKSYLEDCMNFVPDWVAGCPITCEASYAKQYGAC